MECVKSRRLGDYPLNGWALCMDEFYEPKKGDCLVYSYGISNNWSFDDEMGKTYHCDIRAFDPT